MKTLTEALPAWFAKTKVGQRMAEQQALDCQSARVAHARDLKALRKRQERELPPLAEKVAAAADVAKETLTVLKQAEGAYRDAYNAQHSLVLVLEREVGEHKHALRETAPEAIDTFIGELQVELATLRRDPPFEHEETTDFHGSVPTHSNTPSVYRRVEGYVTAIRAAEELKLEALSDDALRDRLTKLRAGIPEVMMEPIG